MINNQPCQRRYYDDFEFANFVNTIDILMQRLNYSEADLEQAIAFLQMRQENKDSAVLRKLVLPKAKLSIPNF